MKFRDVQRGLEKRREAYIGIERLPAASGSPEMLRMAYRSVERLIEAQTSVEMLRKAWRRLEKLPGV